jgi:hypothetical protein
MNMTIRRAGEADAQALSLLNTDVQDLHASALPERFSVGKALRPTLHDFGADKLRERDNAASILLCAAVDIRRRAACLGGLY